MKLEQLPMLMRMAEAREALGCMIRAVEERTGGIVLEIDGSRIDDDLVGLVRPVIAAELRRRLGEIHEDMAALGVEI